MKLKCPIVINVLIAAFLVCLLNGCGEVSDIVTSIGTSIGIEKVFKPKKAALEFQKGMNYVGWNAERYMTSESDESIRALARSGTEWVALVLTWYQENCFTTEIFPTERTPSDESLIHTIKLIHSLGMKVMLKPHLDVLDKSGGAWRGEICFVSDEEWEQWFRQYADFIHYYADFAQRYGADMYCIGVELSSIATIKEDVWKDVIIAPVREYYKGPITYAANWDREYKEVKFWAALDYVGIDAYFPLSDKDKPGLEEIKKGWDKWIVELEEFQSEVSMPIIFTEVGYCSGEGTTKLPWREVASGPVDMKLQADCYEALFQVLWDKPWFYGSYWWRWGTDVRFGGPANRGFSLQNKTAEDVIKAWYGKKTPARSSKIFQKD